MLRLRNNSLGQLPPGASIVPNATQLTPDECNQAGGSIYDDTYCCYPETGGCSFLNNDSGNRAQASVIIHTTPLATQPQQPTVPYYSMYPQQVQPGQVQPGQVQQVRPGQPGQPGQPYSQSSMFPSSISGSFTTTTWLLLGGAAIALVMAMKAKE